MNNNLAEMTSGLDGLMSGTFLLFGILLALYGFYSLISFIFKDNNHPDEYMGAIFRGMFGIAVGGVLLGNADYDGNAIEVLKYVGIGVGTMIVGGIIAAVGMVYLDKKKYKNYTKLTNELLLLSDDFLVLSTNLQTIDDQIVLNSKMIEGLTDKKKENLDLLNSLLTAKRIRFNAIIADVRSSISL